MMNSEIEQFPVDKMQNKFWSDSLCGISLFNELFPKTTNVVLQGIFIYFFWRSGVRQRNSTAIVKSRGSITCVSVSHYNSRKSTGVETGVASNFDSVKRNKDSKYQSRDASLQRPYILAGRNMATTTQFCSFRFLTTLEHWCRDT